MSRFGLNKSPVKVAHHGLPPHGRLVSAHSNPFDSDDELDNKSTIKTSRRTSSEPTLTTPKSSNLFDDDVQGDNSSSSSYATRNNYKNGFSDSGGIDNQSVQELENYAVYKAEETTKAVNNCLKIVEDIREDASKTLVSLHQQGEQITRTHNVAVDMDNDLTRGEKLLGSLGGIFSKTWKPKKTRSITGPTTTKDDLPRKSAKNLQERERLGLNSTTKGQSKAKLPSAQPTEALSKVEVEKAKQDDGLSDLSNYLNELKFMAMDMGSEIERQNKALTPFHDDVDELNFRVRGANERGRRLLRK